MEKPPIKQQEMMVFNCSCGLVIVAIEFCFNHSWGEIFQTLLMNDPTISRHLVKCISAGNQKKLAGLEEEVEKQLAKVERKKTNIVIIISGHIEKGTVIVQRTSEGKDEF